MKIPKWLLNLFKTNKIGPDQYYYDLLERFKEYKDENILPCIRISKSTGKQYLDPILCSPNDSDHYKVLMMKEIEKRCDFVEWHLGSIAPCGYCIETKPNCPCTYLTD